MTAQEIADRLVNTDKGLTPERIMKAKGLALRSQVEWIAVVACISFDRFPLNERGQFA